MLNRSLLLFVAIGHLSAHTVSAKEKGWYFPIIGYTAAYESVSAPWVHGASLLLVGYAFSEDFSLEFAGLGYWEKTLHTIPVQMTKQTSSTPPKRSSTPPPPKSTPNVIADQSDSTPPTIAGTSTSSLRYELGPNPWASTVAGVPGKTDNIASLSDDTFKVSTASPTPTPPLEKPASPLQETPLDTSTAGRQLKPTWVTWGGAALNLKCTLLHLHSRFNVYWSPGLTLLYPLKQDMHQNMSLTLSMGARWIVTANLVVDFSGTTTLWKWGNPAIPNSLLYHSKLQFCKISLLWRL
jgi:hypothetical protein